MTRRTLALRTAPLAGCALVGLLLSGCGGNTTAAAKPSADPSRSASAPVTSSPSPSPTTPPTPPGTPLPIGKASMVIPPGWAVEPATGGTGSFSDPDEAIDCAFGQTAGIGSNRATKKLIDELAKERLGTGDDSRHLPDIIVNGVRLYHLQGNDAGDHTIIEDDYATVNADYLIELNCGTDTQEMPHHKALKKINRVLATFQLR